jgi:hypothetical protein
LLGVLVEVGSWSWREHLCWVKKQVAGDDGVLIAMVNGHGEMTIAMAGRGFEPHRVGDAMIWPHEFEPAFVHEGFKGLSPATTPRFECRQLFGGEEIGGFGKGHKFESIDGPGVRTYTIDMGVDDHIDLFGGESGAREAPKEVLDSGSPLRREAIRTVEGEPRVNDDERAARLEHNRR